MSFCTHPLIFSVHSFLRSLSFSSSVMERSLVLSITRSSVLLIFAISRQPCYISTRHYLGLLLIPFKTVRNLLAYILPHPCIFKDLQGPVHIALYPRFIKGENILWPLAMGILIDD